VKALSSSSTAAVTGVHPALTAARPPPSRGVRPALYTPEQRRRRDATRWTLVQGVLAPLQFVACAVSIGLVVRYLATGQGLWAAQASFVVKCLLLALIMVTGSVWEKRVFDRWLFAPAFFWEDVVSMLVIALHALVLVSMLTPWLDAWLDARAAMLLVLVAYAVYVVNAAQFLYKLRVARRDAPGVDDPTHRAREAGL
jgi:3-vinyl bacteriochlorophyllide hydratase